MQDENNEKINDEEKDYYHSSTSTESAAAAATSIRPTYSNYRSKYITSVKKSDIINGPTTITIPNNLEVNTQSSESNSFSKKKYKYIIRYL